MQLWFAFTSLSTFVLTLFALVLAIQLYALLRTGAIGRTWKFIIGAAAVFGVGQLLRFASFWQFIDSAWSRVGAQITDLLFVILLAWALWLQRQAFYRPEIYRFAPQDKGKGYPSRFERRAPEDAAATELESLSDPDEAFPSDD